jgi:hypothetical protein
MVYAGLKNPFAFADGTSAKFSDLSWRLRTSLVAKPRVSEEYNVNYDLSRALAILRAVHAEMAGADAKWRPAAMADLELTGVKTGALHVPRGNRRRARVAA